MAAPPRPRTSSSGQWPGKVVGEGRPRDVLRHRHDVRARLDGDVADRGQPAVGVVGRRGDPDLRPTLVDGPTGERHPVLPADQAADATERGLADGQVVAGPDAVEQPLVVRRHQLAVPRQQALRAEEEQGVVDRAGRSSSRSLTPIARCTSCSRQASTSAATSGPSTATELSQKRSQNSSACAPEAGRRSPRVGRVERQERLGEHHQLGALRGRVRDQTDGLRHAALEVEDHGRGLHGGHADHGELRHGRHARPGNR